MSASLKQTVFLKRVTPIGVARFFVITSILFFNSISHAEDKANENNLSTSVVEKNNSKDKVLTNITQQVSQFDKDLAYIQLLSQAGAVNLALKNLHLQQPDYKDNPNHWLVWERERISLLITNKQHLDLVERINELPKGINQSFEYWAKTQQASAYIKLQHFDEARQTINRLIWDNASSNFNDSNKWLPHWRRIIIHSYLDSNQINDAFIAITRFRQDYGNGDISDIILYARVLLMNNLLDETLSVLSSHTSHPEAGMLHLLAQLRKGVRSPRIVLQAGLRQMQGDWVNPELKIYLWSIVAEAAQASDDRLAGIKAMEFIFSDSGKYKLPKGLFKLKIDSLWKAYIENAMYIGNKAQYLIGDDPVWLNAAKTFDDIQTANARSLYAFLIMRSQDEKIKQSATELFIKSISKLEGGVNLLTQLFLHSTQFKTKADTPITVRHFLVDDALSHSNIRLASEIMASITTSPQGADQFMWTLRRARVLIMGGNIDEGAKALMLFLDKQTKISNEALDRLMQVVFDLQKFNAHHLAFQAFEKLQLKTDDMKRQREIYFWMADSKKAQMKYTQAATYYLKSAALPEIIKVDKKASENKSVTKQADVIDESLDPWGQTARYQAANSLLKAGLLQDARALYESLLAATKEESRLKIIQQELSQLQLLESSNKVSNN